MNAAGILKELVLVAGIGVLVAAALVRLRLPVIAGLLLAGTAVGPHGFGFVRESHEIEAFAEVGVVLLLFTIGLEFSFKRLAHIGRLVAFGGALQVGVTIASVMALAAVAGEPASRGVFFGFLVALSSTAIVLRALAERQETDAPHGRFILGALIFQDLCVVPMMLLIPVLAGRTSGSPARDAALALGKALGLVVLTLVVARAIVPRLFAWVDRARSREIFLLSVLVVCLGTAWLTSLAGLSLALGAFLAGVVLAESDYAHRAMSDVLPLRDVLTSLFFMSLGMLFDPRVLLDAPLGVGVLFAGLLVGKTAAAALAGLAMRFPPYVALVAGIGLAQFGEFGFVLARAGAEVGLLSREEERVLLAAAILTMAVTPIAVRLAPRLAAGARRLGGLERLLGAQGIDAPAPEHAHLRDHVIVVGYGVAGRVLADALRDSGLRYVVLEINAETARKARSKGEPVYYADVASAEALLHAGAPDARSIVLLINDPGAAERAVAAARQQAPGTPVFVRTHYLVNADRLRLLGASATVVEEVEAGIEMLAVVLEHAGTPGNVIRERVEDARAKTLPSLQEPRVRPRRLGQVPALADLRVESFLVEPDAYASGRSLVELGLRANTGALVVGVQRGGALIQPHDPEALLQPGDVLFVAGPRGALRRAVTLLEEGTAGEARDPEAPPR